MAWAIFTMPLGLGLLLSGHRLPGSTETTLWWCQFLHFFVASSCAAFICWLLYGALLPLLACTLPLRKLRDSASSLVCADVAHWGQLVGILNHSDLTCYALGGLIPGTPFVLIVFILIALGSLVPYVYLV